MKKRFLAVFAAVAVLTAIVGCDGPSAGGDGANNPGTGTGSNVSLLTPDEQKDYLVEVGQEFSNIINPEDQRVAVELAADLYEKYESWDWDYICGDQLENEFNRIDAEGFFRMPSRLAAFATGEQTTFDYKEILFSFAVAGRLFEFDDATRTMRVSDTSDGTIIARFSDGAGKACEVKVWGEGKETEASYTYEAYHWEWNGYEDQKIYDGTRVVRVVLPEKINMYFKYGSTELMSFSFSWDSNLRDYVNHSLSFKVVNIGWSEEANVSTTSATVAFTFSYGNKALLTGAASAPRYQAIGWDGGSNIDESKVEAWLDQYDARYETVLGSLGSGESKVDILGKVQAKMTISDGAAFYDAMREWDDTYYDTDLEDETAYCDIYNKYIYAGIYYGNDTEQAQVKMQPSYSYTSSYDGKDYYYSMPVLYFPKDQTTYEIESFFDSTKFNVLIDMVEDLANAYKDLDTGHIFFDEGRIEF